MVFRKKNELSLYLMFAAFAVPAELGIAQRYFSARQAPGASMAALQGVPAASLRGARFEGARWGMDVYLARPPRPVPRNLPPRPDLRVDYSVEELTHGPVFRLVVRLSSSAWVRSGVSWEQEFVEAASGGPARSRIRPCSAQECGPWRDWEHGRVVPTAGRHELPIGIQAPLFLPIGWFAPRWQGEDFFGREAGLVWDEGSPWPQRLWNAQGEARMSPARGGA